MLTIPKSPSGRKQDAFDLKMQAFSFLRKEVLPNEGVLKLIKKHMKEVISYHVLANIQNSDFWNSSEIQEKLEKVCYRLQSFKSSCL